jgi:hypothetical protein
LEKEVKMREYITKVKKIGNSYFILVPPSIVDELEFKEAKYVKVKINAIGKSEVPIKYACRECLIVFESDDEKPHCPDCGKDNLRQIDDIIDVKGGE